MIKLYLLRHGKVSGPAALYGRTDIGVNETINQVIVTTFIEQNLAIDKIYSSSLSRCRSLAKTLLAHHDVCTAELTIIDNFKEIYFGCYDGIAFDTLYQIPEKWRQLERFWQAPVEHTLPDAELLGDFYQRIVCAWQSLRQGLFNDAITEQNSSVLLVCHGGVIRMILAYILDIYFGNARWFSQLDIGYGSLTTIELTQHSTVIKQIAQPLYNG